VLIYSGPESNREHMKFMLETEIADAHGAYTDEHGVGWQSAEQWQTLSDFLVTYDAMQPVDSQKAYTTSLLEAIYP